MCWVPRHGLLIGAMEGVTVSVFHGQAGLIMCLESMCKLLNDTVEYSWVKGHTSAPLANHLLINGLLAIGGRLHLSNLLGHILFTIWR